MEFSGLIPSSDNLYKYLFIGGLAIIVFSFVYSFEQKQNLLLECNLFKKQSALLEVEIDQVKSEIRIIHEAIEEIENRMKDTTANHEDLIDLKKEQYKKIIEQKEKKQEILIKQIMLDFEGERIVISTQLNKEVIVYKWVLLLLGSFAVGYGLYKWLKFTEIAEKKSKAELKLIEKQTK